ncbi:hypothetical protein ES707_13104 [subsurface metagenome]
MTIDEAIKIQTEIIRSGREPSCPGEMDAAKLLIEAGKAIRTYRETHHHYIIPQLPGETKD